jgi:hypothetical protein
MLAAVGDRGGGARVTEKLWGGEPYYGLDDEFDPLWLLTPERLELQERLIEVCHDVIRPQAIECDRTGAYPREPKAVALAACTQSESGGLSTDCRPPASKDTTKKLRPLRSVLRTAAE